MVFTDWRNCRPATRTGRRLRVAGHWRVGQTEAARPQKDRYRKNRVFRLGFRWPDGRRRAVAPSFSVLPRTAEKAPHRQQTWQLLQDLLVLCGGVTRFMGSGTTGVTAAFMGKRFIGIEINRTQE